MQKVLLLSLLLASLLNIAYSCQSMQINGVTYYCPSGTSNFSNVNGSLTCDGRPATTSCGSSGSSSSSEDKDPQSNCPNTFGPYSGDSQSRSTKLAGDLEKCDIEKVAFTYYRKYFTESHAFTHSTTDDKVAFNRSYKSLVLQSSKYTIKQSVQNSFENDVKNLEWSCWCYDECNLDENLDKMRDRYSSYNVSVFKFTNGSGYPGVDEYRSGVTMATRYVSCYNDYYYTFVLH